MKGVWQLTTYILESVKYNISQIFLRLNNFTTYNHFNRETKTIKNSPPNKKIKLLQSWLIQPQVYFKNISSNDYFPQKLKNLVAQSQWYYQILANYAFYFNLMIRDEYIDFVGL